MRKKIYWITETAVLLALLVTLQAVTKPAGQLVTGSFVNAVLAIATLVAGLSSGLTIAIISPILAFLLGIAPQPLTVPAIMVGNTVYVVLLHFLCSNRQLRLFPRILGLITAAGSKFITLYSIVALVLCKLLAQPLAIKPKMAEKLIATFSWPQLITALIGGGVALLIAPLIKKALRK